MRRNKQVRGLVAAATVAIAAGVASVTAAGGAVAATSWLQSGSRVINPLRESQGLASMDDPAGTSTRTTSAFTIPSSVSSRGWNHVGDPDGLSGYYIEPYESSSATAKMFRVQNPAGTWSEYTHTLASGEAYNNSFAAISPDGQWMVSGEYGTKSRLLVFPMPGLNAGTSPSQNLPLAATINLSRAVRDVQGCDFVTSTELICASDDPAGTLFGVTKPLLQVELSAPLGSGNLTGTVTAIRQVPLVSNCSGTFETEGIDYNAARRQMTVLVISPGICVISDSKAWLFTATAT